MVVQCFFYVYMAIRFRESMVAYVPWQIPLCCLLLGRVFTVLQWMGKGKLTGKHHISLESQSFQ